MPTPAKFRYSLKTTDDTKWYYWTGDPTNPIGTSTTPKYFTDNNEVVSPKEWADTEIGVTRNETYFGVFTKFNIPITYTYQAMYIVKYLFATEGYESAPIFVIEQTDNYTWVYSEIYRCELDYTTIRNADGKQIGTTITASELSLVSDLKNKENVSVEIPFDSDALTINHDGIKLTTSYRWLAGDPNTPSDYGSELFNRLSYPDFGFVSIEDNAYLSHFIFPVTQQYHYVPNDSGKYIMYTALDILADITLSFDIEYSTSVSASARGYLTIFIDEILFSSGSYARVPKVLYTDPTGILPGDTIRVSGTAQLSLQIYSGRTYKLGFRIGDTGGLASAAVVEYKIYNLDLKISGVTRLPSSDVKAYPYLTFLNKLFKASLNSSVNVISNYLGTSQSLVNNFDNPAKWTTVTSGDALRSADDAVIKTTIREARQDMYRWGLGIGVEGNNIRVEKLSYFFQHDRLISTLDTATNIIWYAAIDYLGNIIKTGYNNQTYDNLNGKEDFFNTSEWNFPSRRVSKEIDWTSPYYASPWAIEYARTLGLASKNTTDSQYDNQTYLIDVDGTPVSGKYKLLRRQLITGNSVHGLTYPETCYNFGLSPATVLRFNSQWLLSMGYGSILSGKTVTWQTNDKNANVDRDLDSYYIQEDGPFIINSLATDPSGGTVLPLFQPIIFEFDTALPVTLIEQLKANTEDKYGVIKFPYYSEGVLRGYLDVFILDAVCNPATNGLYRFRGLSSPTNNLNIL